MNPQIFKIYDFIISITYCLVQKKLFLFNATEYEDATWWNINVTCKQHF